MTFVRELLIQTILLFAVSIASAQDLSPEPSAQIYATVQGTVRISNSQTVIFIPDPQASLHGKANKYIVDSNAMFPAKPLKDGDRVTVSGAFSHRLGVARVESLACVIQDLQEWKPLEIDSKTKMLTGRLLLENGHAFILSPYSGKIAVSGARADEYLKEVWQHGELMDFVIRDGTLVEAGERLSEIGNAKSVMTPYLEPLHDRLGDRMSVTGVLQKGDRPGAIEFQYKTPTRVMSVWFFARKPVDTDLFNRPVTVFVEPGGLIEIERIIAHEFEGQSVKMQGIPHSSVHTCAGASH